VSRKRHRKANRLHREAAGIRIEADGSKIGIDARTAIRSRGSLEDADLRRRLFNRGIQERRVRLADRCGRVGVCLTRKARCAVGLLAAILWQDDASPQIGEVP
jgi:hypothetical protein